MGKDIEKEIWEYEKCPVTSLPIYCNPDWVKCTYNDNNYKVSFAVIGENIVFSKAEGSVNLDSMQGNLKQLSSIIRQRVPASENYFLLSDYSKLKEISIQARNYYLNHIKRDTKLAGVINYNVPSFLKLLLKTGYRLAKPEYSIHVVNNYTEAISIAVNQNLDKSDFKFNDSDTKIISLPNKKKVDNFIKSKLKELKKDKIRPDVENYVEELLEFIADINWETGNKFKSSIKISPDHPFKSVFDSLQVLKHDFDITFLQHEKSQQDLKQAYEEMEERVLERTAELIVTNRQLAEAKNIADTEAKKAQTANEAKSTFLANISHEIRTPFNGIMGFAQLIANSSNPKMHGEYSTHIIKECKKLLFLVNQLLDLSKIEAGKIELEKTTFSMNELINDVNINFKSLALNKGLYFKTKICSNVPMIVIGDIMKIRQVLFNLIGNAVKFTDSGGIELIINKDKDISETEKLIHFRVIDTGVGISKHKMNTIFESFTQADNTITRKFGGTGLGTTISKEFVELMDGEIGLRSNETKGSEFWFTIKLGLGNEEDLERIDTSLEDIPLLPLKGVRILAAEDYMVNRDILKNFLETAEASVTLVENGKLAVDAFLHKEFDCILMDLMMPIMSGIDATEEIRKHPKGKNIPIIGITANAFEKDKQACFTAGMNDFIAKPFDMGPLIYKIGKWVLPEDIFKRSIYINKAIVKTPDEVIKSSKPCDVESYIERMNGDKEIVKFILGGFLDQIEKQIPSMENAIKENDYVTLEREAHSIKGGALNIIADNLMESAKALEFASKEKVPANATQLLDDLTNKFNELKKFLKKYYSAILY